MNLFIVIGIGANELEIPLVPFGSKKEAEEFIDLFPKDPKYEYNLAESFSDAGGEDVEEDKDGLYARLFKDGNYYSGCGGCYALKVVEVELGQPMVGWDLD